MVAQVTEAAEDLLRRASICVDEQLRKPSAFNPATLLLRREVDLSRVIGWMLDPRGSHGEDEAFLSLFLEMVKLPDIPNLRSARVRLEVPCFEGKILLGRIDIEILHPNFLILIENKPTAGLGSNQLERYHRCLPTDGSRKAKVVFLPGAEQSTTTAATVLHLGKQIRNWVEQCRDLAQLSEVRFFLDSLQKELEDRYDGRGSNVIPGLLQLMTETPDAVMAAVAISDERDNLTEKIANDFSAAIDSRARRTGIGYRRDGNSKALFKKENGAISIDIGHQAFDFIIQADQPNFQSIAIGICLRAEDKDLGHTYADEIVRLSQSLGASAEPPDSWWLWFERFSDLDVGGLRTKTNAAIWGWVADTSDSGLAARFVERAGQAKTALQGVLGT
ncbi:MAG: PD-(D/E)XK nuclease family protein [Janthinobacterium lividum]